MNLACWINIICALFLAGLCGWDIATGRIGVAAAMIVGIAVNLVALLFNSQSAVLRSR